MITFCEYMKRALGDPLTGYYTSKARIGFSDGDFYTAPEASPAFASLMALQIQEMDRILGAPDPFYLIEAGPGNGTLASSLLTIFMNADPDLFRRLAPVFFELPGILEEAQRRRLSDFPLRYKPRWVSGESATPSAVLGAKRAGVVFGNEFLDALPVHRVRVIGGQWKEAYVDTGADGRLVEEWGACSSDLLQKTIDGLFPGRVSAKMEGKETEICLAVPPLLDLLDSYLDRGFMVWIDYGDIGIERHSDRRKTGTLLAYKEQKVSGDLLAEGPGNADLTAFVDFSQVALHLFFRGYRLEGYTDQMSWLMGLGLPDWIAVNGDRLSPREIEGASTLVHPLKMGRIFKVLAMSRAVPDHEPLLGFRFGGLRSPLWAPPDGGPEA